MRHRLLLLALCLGLLIAAGVPRAQEPASTDKVAKDVEWTGGLGASSAWRNEDVAFWVRVVNKSDALVESLRFRPVGGDVSVVAVCGPGREPPCVTADTSLTVPANSEKAFEGVLRVDGTGERELALLLTADGHQWSVPLG